MTVSVEEFAPPVFNTTLVGVTVTDGPAGEREVVIAIVPAKPLKLVSVILELPWLRLVMVKLLGAAERVNPFTNTIAFAGTLSEPFEPVNVTV